MALDYRRIAADVQVLLRTHPRVTLAGVAVALKADRHTIARALRRECGTTFRSLQAEATIRESERLLAERPHSRKELSHTLGYRSPASLSRLVKRGRTRSSS